MPNAAPHPEHIRVETVRFDSQGHPLTGTLFAPKAQPSAVVLISGGVGIGHGFYRAFAEWLATERNCICLTFDYRDYGASATGPLRQSKAKLTDWGIHDQMAARQYLRQQYPSLPLWLVGHSLGALMLPFHPDLEDVERIIAVASGPVHWTDHPPPLMAGALALWFGHGPVSAKLFGYLPGRWIGLGADLPPGVYWQWRKWCTTRGFYGGDIGTDLPKMQTTDFEGRMKFIAVGDDETIPPAVVWRLMQHFPNAPKRQRVLHPTADTAGKIGHIGAFSAKNRALWPEIMRDFTPPKPATEYVHYEIRALAA